MTKELNLFELKAPYQPPTQSTAQPSNIQSLKTKLHEKITKNLSEDALNQTKINATYSKSITCEEWDKIQKATQAQRVLWGKKPS